MSTNKQKLAGLWDELKRAVGVIENKVESKTLDAMITFDELDVSAELKARLRELDLNGDGKLTLEELQLALKKNLDPATERVVKQARETVNQEIMALYSEALEAFTKYRTRLEQLQGTGVDAEALGALTDRANKIQDHLGKMVAVLKKKPEAMGPMRGQIREFIRDVKALEKAR